jgi:hypothetical protein
MWYQTDSELFTPAGLLVGYISHRLPRLGG